MGAASADREGHGLNTAQPSLTASPDSQALAVLRLVRMHALRGRWDGWDDPDYQPTEAELEEPIEFPGIEDATLEDLAQALMRHRPAPRGNQP